MKCLPCALSRGADHKCERFIYCGGGVAMRCGHGCDPGVFSKLEWQGDCLVFTGRIKDGYGVTSETSLDGVRRFLRTHRVVYEVTIGELPADMYVLHSCDNRACCNPEHLRLGTHEENMRDRAERGRTFNGRSAFTHCRHGHPYDEENTYRNADGRRSCRACHRERARVARDRKKAS